jgi:oligo-1,6-glucosidase
LKTTMSRWQEELHGKGWNALYFNNHDQPRAVSRFGDDQTYHTESAKLLATYIHTLEGTPFIYQGEEIGMTNVAFESIDDYRDVEILNYYRHRVLENGEDPKTVLKRIHAKGRDNARTPMQWSANEQAGFTTGTPWIKVNLNYTTINVETQLQDPNSILNYYKRLIALRKQHEVIVYGTYQLLLPDHPEIYAYTRTLGKDQLLVILNFSAKQPVFQWEPNLFNGPCRLLISNYDVDPTEPIDRIQLRPYEARVYLLREE